MEYVWNMHGVGSMYGVCMEYAWSREYVWSMHGVGSMYGVCIVYGV